MSSAESSDPGLDAATSAATRGAERPRVAAIIVAYQLTTAELLDRLLGSLVGQVAGIFVVDNTPAGTIRPDVISPKFQHCVCHLSLGENTGVPYALTVGIRRAAEDKYTHVLFLDHDSALPPGMVEQLLADEAAISASGERVAAVGPVFRDEKTGQLSTAIRHRHFRVDKLPIDIRSSEPVESDYIIGSGSLISLRTLSVVGMPAGQLFLDWFDIEWGLRAKRMGYKCFISPRAVMLHSIGDKAIRFLGKDINLHSDGRTYYLVRNAVYLMRCRHMGWEWRTVTGIKIPQYIVFYSLCSRTPVHCLLLLLRGFLHGCIGRLGRLD